MDFHDLLKFQIESEAPDMHLQVGDMPRMRNKSGEVLVVEKYHALTERELEEIAKQVMGEERFKNFMKRQEFDGSYALKGVSHFRVNACVERNGISIDFRSIPEKIPSLEDLGLPELVAELTELPSGLVLVTGPNGHGKSTTLAAMIQHLNAKKHYHILTIEDPIEFIYPPGKSLITQREVGTHSKSFAEALKHAFRQDLNVVVLGEMRDLETMATAITLAETGYLVFATLHTYDAVSTINRMIDVFPSTQQEQIRTQLSLSLRGVICQQLIPLKEGQGRVAAREILLVDYAVSNLIRKSELEQIPNHIQLGMKQGMMLFDDSLIDLYKRGLIDANQVLLKAQDLDGVKAKLKS